MHSLELMLLILCSSDEANTISMGSLGDSSRLVSHVYILPLIMQHVLHHHETSCSLKFDGHWRLFVQLGLL
jgi:hypothetical protein